MTVNCTYNFSSIPWTGGLPENRTNGIQTYTTTNQSNSPEKDTIELNNTTTQSNNSATQLEKNKGFVNFVKHLFTGKDYYTTSTGVKISTDKNTGTVVELADGTAYVEGAQNAKIKGNRKDNNIYVASSTVEEIKGKGGNDTITIVDSDVNKVNGNTGSDSITASNSFVKDINGGTGADNIYGSESIIYNINGSFGKDTVQTENGTTGNVKSSAIDNVTIKDSPIYEGPEQA